MTWRFLLIFTTSIVIISPATADEDKPEPAEPSYHKGVLPIFRQHCFGCHQPAKAYGEYILTDFKSMMQPGETGKKPVVPGKPDESYLIEEIRVIDGQHEMPKNKPPLSKEDIALITEWVRLGAKDDTPESAQSAVIDQDNPPVYQSLPVVTSLAYSPDGKYLAVSGFHETLLYNAEDFTLEGRLIGLSERVQSLAFSKDGKYLAVAAGDPGRVGEVQIWEVAQKRLTQSIPVTFDTVYGVSWHPEGTMVAVGCADNTVRGFDPFNGKQLLQMGTHSDWVLGTVFSQDGEHLASVSRDMTLKLTEVPTQRFIDNVTSITPGALKGGLMTVDLRPMKEKKMQKVPEDTPGAEPKIYDELLVAGSDGTPRLYKMHRETKRVIGDDANRVKEFAKMPGRVSSVRFNTDGERFAAASSLDGKGEVAIYDVQSGNKIVCENVSAPVYTVTWQPDGKVIASSGFTGMIQIHDAATGKLIKELSSVPVTMDK